MSQEERTAAPRVALDARERRVLGVLIEKALTTPEYYPMTVNALVAGCNQKNNRDPITHYTDEDIEAALESLRAKAIVESGTPWTGRAARWKQDFGRVHGLDAVETAVLGELLLRGAQSMGELRARANRMRPIADLGALDAILGKLRGHAPPLVLRLTAEGTVRGVRVTHNLYLDSERAGIVADEAGEKGEDFTPRERFQAPPIATAEPRPAPIQTPREAPPARTSGGGDVADLRDRIAALEARMARLESALGVEGSGSER